MGTTILLVDDDSSGRRLAKLLLTMSGFSVLEAESGQQAVQTAIEQNPDVILLDMMLPDFDGSMVVSKLKAAEYKGKIVLFSASTHDVLQKACTETGADDFITKPFDEETLLAKLAS